MRKIVSGLFESVIAYEVTVILLSVNDEMEGVDFHTVY